MKKFKLIFLIIFLFISVVVFLYYKNIEKENEISILEKNIIFEQKGQMMGVGGVFDDTGNSYIGTDVFFKIDNGEEVSYRLLDNTMVYPLKYNCLDVRDCTSWKNQKGVLFEDFENLEHKLECKNDPNWCLQNKAIWQIVSNDKKELLKIIELQN